MINQSPDVPTATITDSQDLRKTWGQQEEENIETPKIATSLSTAGKFDEFGIDGLASLGGALGGVERRLFVTGIRNFRWNFNC